MATLKGAKAAKAKAASKKAAAATKATTAKKAEAPVAEGRAHDPAPGSGRDSTGTAGNTEPGAPPESAGASAPPVDTPENIEIITKAEAMTSLVVTSEGAEIAPGISMLPSLKIAASLIPFKKRADELQAMAARAVINSPETYERGVRFLSMAKDAADQLETYRKSVKGPIDDYARYIQSLFMPLINQIKAATAMTGSSYHIVANKMLAYKNEEDRKAREKAEEQRRQQQEEAARLAEEERQRGNAEGAQAIEEAAAAAPAPQVQSSVSNVRVGGVAAGVTKTWQGTVVAPMEVLKAIIDGKVPISVFEWSQSGLNAYARSIKVAQTVNGIKLEEKETMGVRR